MSKHKKKTTTSFQPMGWYYMCKNDITVDEIHDAISEIADKEGYQLEVWKEDGVDEVEIEEKKSMDIEQCELDLGDAFSNDYLQAYGVKTLFYIAFAPDIFDKCEPLLKRLVSNPGGKICADTEDFTPEIGQ